jgi:MFS family permease
MTVAEAVTSARPQWLSRRLTPVAWVSVLSLALAGTLAAMTLGGPWVVVALLCLFAAATGFAYPVQRKLVNDAVPPQAPRATLLSVESIVDRAVCALAAVAAGAYLSAGHLDALLWHSALATAVLLGAFQLLLRSGVVKRARGISGADDPGVRSDGPEDTWADEAAPPGTAHSRARPRR